MNSPLVSTEWLDNNLNNTNLVLLDASMQKVIGKEPIVYEKLICIPGSLNLELENNFFNRNSEQVNAIPTEEQFTQGVQKLGINHDSHIVIYDNQGIYSSPRAWWTFKSMGLENVSVLNGGLPQWLKEGRQCERNYRQLPEKLGDFTATYQKKLVCDYQTILDNLDNPACEILDARGSKRFMGIVDEPRQNMRSGHIPGSKNLPFAELMQGHCFKEVEALKETFNNLVDQSDKQLFFTCGSGITACILILAAHHCGYDKAVLNMVLYDGSWADWGSNHSLPYEKSN